MTVKEIATKLAEYCRKEDYMTAQKELYADDVVSIEPEESEAFAKETKGLKAVNEKVQKFNDMIEESYGNTVSEPIIAGNSFAFIAEMDIKMKGQERSKMAEVAVYTVKDGKVVKEEFFW